MKYELIPTADGKLFRIRALKSFSNRDVVVSKGDLGGFVSGMHNLSQIDNCWIHKQAYVTEQARVLENALIENDAKAFDSARLKGNSRVSNFSVVCGYAIIDGIACLTDFCKVSENAKISGNTVLKDNSRACGNVDVRGGTFENQIFLRYGIVKNSSFETLVRCSAGLPIIDGKIIAYKYVIKGETGFHSMHDYGFKYYLNETAECLYPSISNESCAPGLHCGDLSYWEDAKENNQDIHCCLMVEVKKEDVITIQEGKIRCKRLKVIGIVENSLED